MRAIHEQKVDKTRRINPPIAPMVARKILTRRIYRSDGTHQWERTVFCPQLNKRTGVDHCQACREFRSYRTNSDTGVPESVKCCPHPLGETKPVPPESTVNLSDPVLQIMSSETICIHRDCPLPTVQQSMISNAVGCVLIVNDLRHPIGIVTRTDLLDKRLPAAIAESIADVTVRTQGGYIFDLPATEAERLARITAGELMTPAVETLPISATIGEAAGVMAENQIKRLPIVDESHEILGVISSHDILRWLATSAGHVPDLPSGAR